MSKNKLVSIVSSLAIALTASSLVGCASTQTKSTNLASGAHCSQLTGADEVLQQMYAPGGIKDARPIKERIFIARANQPIRTMGATVSIQAEPGMNAPYLHRVLACHAAADTSAYPNDPLHPESGSVDQLIIREGQNRFTVEIRANRPQVGKEIWQRAQAARTRG